MIGRVGRDGFGSVLLETLSRDGVDTQHIRRDEMAPTGVALITVDQKGQNSIVVAPGANGRLTREDLLDSETAFQKAGVVLLQLEIPLSAVSAAVELAHRHGAKVILNPAPAQPLPVEILKNVDILIPNEREVRQLNEQDSHLTAEQAARRLQELGAGVVVVTLGERGALVLDGSQQEELSGYPVSVVDTTAAGDAFVAAFAVALVEGLNPREAARWGNAAGAIAVTRPGAQPSLPTRAELEEFVSTA
jgi:ribokinase